MIRRWSLRVQLVVPALLVTAVLCAVIGVLVTVSLHGYLYGQLQSQVDGAVHLAVNAPFDQPRGGSSAQQLDFLRHPGLPADTIGGYVGSDGTLEKAGYAVWSGGSGGGPGRVDIADLSSGQMQALAGSLAPGTHQVSIPGEGHYLVEVASFQPGTPGAASLLIGVPTTAVDSTVGHLVATTVVVSAIGLIAAGVCSAWLTRRALRPLDRVAATAARVARLPLHRGEVGELDRVRVPEADTDPRTEAGKVGHALNRLLDHVTDALAARHASETRVRQFVADASHELRTPLASIRGYAELTRRGGEQVPPDTAYALRRVESEAGRMTRLVEDLLLLARLDSGRPLEREQVDLAPLVVDAVRDAHAAGPEHDWRVRLPEDGADPVVIGDQHRLQQVLVNLLANARSHTPAGTTVTASVEVEPGRCVLRVVDDGPGIPEELQPRVFERFARGDASRSRAAGSTGLGLAIVSAVVTAHGGAVEVDSAPGRTEFRVRLPGVTAGQRVGTTSVART